MTRERKLKSSARAAALSRGHNLSRFRQGGVFSATCNKCGMSAYVCLDVAPNGIDISGKAVSLNCASDIPADYPVKPLLSSDDAKDRATCGTCGRSWDDSISTSMTPTPAARCPFEAFHDRV